MKPTLKDYIKRMSDDELYAHFDLVLKEMNERKAKENELIDYLEGGEKNPHHNKEEAKKNCLFI